MTILNKVDIGMNEALLFKIAAVGILVSVLSQVLKHSGREEQASDQSGRASACAVLDHSLCIRTVSDHAEIIYALRREIRMLRIAMIGIAGVLLALQVKALKPEYGIYLCLAVSLLVFLQMTDLLGMILAGLQTVQESLPLQAGYFKILLKIIGITYIAEFASDLCKDAGYATIAGQIQMFGKLSVLAAGIPVLTALLETIRGFLS